jgi:uncharacterized protein YacL
MYNLYAFVKWMIVRTVRWVMTGPRRLHNWCIEFIEDEDTESVFLAFGLGGLVLGTIVSIVVSSVLWKIFKIPDFSFWVITAIPAMFLSTVAVRVLYRKFRKEQEEIFNILKKDYRA